MDDSEQSQNPMSFMSEMFGKMMSGEGENPAKAMMERAQEAAGKAQKAQAAMMENMRGMMDGAAWMPGAGGASEAAGDGSQETGSASSMDDMQRMMGQMSGPWVSFLQLDRKSRLKMLEQHRAGVVSYMDMLDSAIETLRSDLDAQADDAS